MRNSNINTNTNDNSNDDFLSSYLNSMLNQQEKKSKSGSVPLTPKISSLLQSPFNLNLPRPTTIKPSTSRPTTAASLILHKLSSDQLVTKKQQEKQQEKTDQILDDDESFFDESDSAFSSQQDEIEDDDAFADIPASQLRFIQSMMDAQAWDIPTITSPYKFWTGKLFHLVCYMCL